MTIYFVPLFFLVWALVAQIRRDRQADIRALAVCTFAIALIAGLRWYSDADYAGYADLYNQTPMLGDFNQESIALLFGEAGYLFISAALKTLGGGFFLLAFGCALSGLYLKSAAVRKLSEQASLAMCLYLCLHFITIEFIQMRWAVAAGLLSMGFCFQYLQKYKPAVLCFALAAAFHYFSFLFWIVSLVVTLKGYKRFYFLFLASVLGALFLKLDYFSGLLPSADDASALSRLVLYVNDPDYGIGLFSYAKLLMYPVIYSLCVWHRPSYPWKTDRLNLFLFKLSFVSLSVAFLGSLLPILLLRTMVVADFFSIIWVLNAMDKAFDSQARLLSFGAISALFATWYLIDLALYSRWLFGCLSYLADAHIFLCSAFLSLMLGLRKVVECRSGSASYSATLRVDLSLAGSRK